MPTPAQQIQAKLKVLVERFMKLPTITRIGFSLGVLAVIYALLMVTSPFNCFINLIVPLLFIGVLWKLKIQGIKQLLIIGVLGSLVIAGIYADVAARYYQDVPAQTAESDDREMFDGTVTPLYGTSETLYNYTITIRLPSNSSVVTNITVLIGDLKFYGGEGHNYTMVLLERNDTVAKYHNLTTVPHPLNLFVFWANIDGEWFIAGNQNPSTRSPLPTYGVEGPVQNDFGALFALMLPFGLYAGFVNIFPVYVMLILMVWWLKRARQMRVDSYQKAMAEREKEHEGVSKDEAKVPSLAKAMGVEGGEGFVCSECGADVPGDAKVCPKCGEKFD